MGSSIFPNDGRGVPLFRKLSLLSLLAALLLFIAGCGGGSSTTTNTGGTTTGGTTTGTTGTGGGSSTTPNSATVVPVVAGVTASGVDINVVSPGASPQANAELLGVGTTAFNTGAIIHRGATMEVLLFGQGLNGSMQITISGPNDIAVSNIRAIQSTSGTPGVAFDAAVSGNAALGARTVALKGTNNDVTTFTGGLEVMP